MDYLMRLAKLMKTSLKRSWQILIVLHPVKTNALQDWLDAEIVGKINKTDKLFKKFKKSRLHVDKDNHKEARNEVQNFSVQRKKFTLKVN